MRGQDETSDDKPATTRQGETMPQEAAVPSTDSSKEVEGGQRRVQRQHREGGSTGTVVGLAKTGQETMASKTSSRDGAAEGSRCQVPVTSTREEHVRRSRPESRRTVPVVGVEREDVERRAVAGQ